MLPLVLIFRNLHNLNMRLARRPTLLFGVRLMAWLLHDAFAPANLLLVARPSTFDGCTYISIILMEKGRHWHVYHQWGDGFWSENGFSTLLFAQLYGLCQSAFEFYSLLLKCFTVTPGAHRCDLDRSPYLGCSLLIYLFLALPSGASLFSIILVHVDDSWIVRNSLPSYAWVIAELQKSLIWILDPCILWMTLLMTVWVLTEWSGSPENLISSHSWRHGIYRTVYFYFPRRRSPTSLILSMPFLKSKMKLWRCELFI